MSKRSINHRRVGAHKTSAEIVGRISRFVLLSDSSLLGKKQLAGKSNTGFMKSTRGLSHETMLGGLSAGADPFAYISQLTTRRFTPRLPQSAVILVAVFLIFHILLAAFNLVILLLPYIGKAKRPQWIFKKLYIYARSGEKRLFGTPLYLVNTGVLMSVSQLLSSVTTQAYIWMQIKMNSSEHYSLHSQFFPALGLMFIFNTCSYWSMTHCFLALYYSNKNFTDKSKRMSWLRSPLSINIFFAIFPISVTVSTIVVVTRMSMVYRDLQVQTKSLRATLSQGSLIWKKLKLPDHSDEKANLSSQLTKVQDQLDALLEQTGTLVPKLLDRFNSVRSIMLFFIPATSLVFVLSFWKLAQRYKLKCNVPIDPTSSTDFSDSWNANKSCKHLSVRSNISRTSQTFFQTLRSDPQFLRLTLRAFATLLGMLTGMVFWFLAIFKLSDMMIDPYWHGVATWLPTVSGSWTAIPVAWQSWRLYLDQNLRTADNACKLEDSIDQRAPSDDALSITTPGVKSKTFY
ncbi:hypothetical protein PTTG_12405 [Puccinia triticina 1-1 BBBD Race 1]|uniref:Uncharacterized protein n=2 Tax=Puccinia triticina TaxID=208348 RepID=A0A180G6V9_PUCT1|nr:uncharacterized protein PtA15_12A60 [Puccinia triticina]OAV87623.1 hypothetical protein PTTG_12405 [Puccinia triticina 1-1 BBBD Race 1]WAQ90075.1 hypothetical protein PtA15_12A60 [Puccinia triticina]